MKKLILSIAACLLCSVAAQAQFVLTPQGFFNSEDQSKDYYVMECPGLSQTELFMKAEAFLSTKYEIIIPADRESILVSGVAPRAVVDRHGAFNRSRYDMFFNLTLELREGRIRIMRPVISAMMEPRSGVRTETQVTKIKNTDGEVIGSEEREVNVPYRSVGRLFVSPYYTMGGEYPGNRSNCIYNKNNKLKMPVAKESLEVYFNNLIISLHRYIMSPYEEW